VISSVAPVVVEVMVTNAVVEDGAIVMMKSMTFVPLTDFTAEPFVDKPV
jgi:hypothetical protein